MLPTLLAATVLFGAIARDLGIYIAVDVVFLILIVVVLILRKKGIIPSVGAAPRQKKGRLPNTSSDKADLGSLDLAADQISKLKKVADEDQTKAIDFFSGTQKSGCLGKKALVSEAEYDEIVVRRLNEFGAKARALRKIGMDESQVSEITPIRFYGFENRANRVSPIFASGVCEDGRWRSSVYSATWLFFGDDELLVYNVRFDLLSDAKTETTEEYFYKDITNFETLSLTEQENNTSMIKGCFGKAKESTSKRLIEYNSFGLSVSGSDFACAISGVADAERIIQGMKQKLREKKMK